MRDRAERARVLSRFGSIVSAVESGEMPQFQDISVSETMVLGLFNQEVKKYIGIFGHGTTDIAEVLRTYEEHGLVKTYNMRHETAAAHAATLLKMTTGETSAVITSIGPGALHAFAGSLAAVSNGAGVYHIYGDETTHDEGFNMQQIPNDEQGSFLKMCSVMSGAYALYEPHSVFTALRRGSVQTGRRGFSGPFFLLAPMNVQPAIIRDCNLLELPGPYSDPVVVCNSEAIFKTATEIAGKSKRICIKIGQGARGCSAEIIELARLLDAAIVSGPNAAGIVPYSEPRNMTVGGSKGTLSGNYAMNEADLAVIIGARAVCQWDCSGTAWKNARNVINFNYERDHAAHYNRTVSVQGDARSNLQTWISYLKKQGFKNSTNMSEWLSEITGKRSEWNELKRKRYCNPVLFDAVWSRDVITQPAAIKAACDFADTKGVIKIFDAGDVQANGFQIVEDEREGQTFTDTGASYMGLASSSIMLTALSDRHSYAIAFSGDGSFMMNPQILIDATQHGARGCIIIFDNRKMAAITGLQYAQYGSEYKTGDTVEIDYVAMANSVKGVKGIFGGYSIDELNKALDEAFHHPGLSIVHVPVYCGPDELGGMGVFGDWNVGNWCERVQTEHHRIGL